MQGLNIDIQRTGFPVKIGVLELWFDASLENLKTFFKVEELAQEKLDGIKKKAKHVHFPEELNEDTIKEEHVESAIDLNKEFIAIQYDIIFGDGTFKKIYKQYPDILALENALDPLGLAIAERIESLEAERTKTVEEKAREYLAKKNAKRK